MPEEIKITAEKLESANEPKGKRKIKFAQRSFLAFKNGRKQAMELKQKRLREEYADALADLKSVAKDAEEGKVVNPDAVLARKIDKLAVLNTKIAELDIDFRRFEQLERPKPIKLGKGFIENIRKIHQSNSEVKREKEHVMTNLFNQYNTSKKEVIEQVGREEPISDVAFSSFSVPTAVEKKEVEPVRMDNASSLFANMKQPSVKPQSSVVDEPPFVPPVYYQPDGYNSFSQNQAPYTSVVDEPPFVPPVYQPDDYNSFSQNQAPYIDGVQHIFELPPAREKDINETQNVAVAEPEVSPEIALQPVAEKGLNDDDKVVDETVPDISYTAPISTVFDAYDPNKQNLGTPDNSSYSENEVEVKKDVPEYQGGYTAPIREIIKPAVDISAKEKTTTSLEDLSTEEIQQQMQQMQAILEARDKERKAELEAQSKANHEHLSAFTRDFYQKDEFKYTRSDLADIERQEAERAARLERERAERILAQKKKEVMDALVEGQLSPEKMEVYITEGILTAEDISAKMQDDSLTSQQTMSLAGAEWLAKKITANTPEETILSESSSKSK